MEPLPDDFKHSDFYVATAATPIPSDKTRYALDIKADWCIGMVPNGGYLMSCLGVAVSKFFMEHYPQLDQPDMITGNFEFLGRSVVGPAEAVITVLKSGRQFSTARVQLFQGKTKQGQPALAIEALITQGNLEKEAKSGLMDLPTRPVYPNGLPSLKSTKLWVDHIGKFRPAVHKIEYFLQTDVDDNVGVRPSLGPSVREQWMRWAGNTGAGKGFNNLAMGLLADAFRPIPEQYDLQGNWYPTMNARVEVKKKEPAGGWPLLFTRLECKVIKSGRFDYDLTMFDPEGQIVAVSHHTGLIVSAARNYKAKGADAKI